jgi:hypothetical protein
MVARLMLSRSSSMFVRWIWNSVALYPTHRREISGMNQPNGANRKPPSEEAEAVLFLSRRLPSDVDRAARRKLSFRRLLPNRKKIRPI